MARIAGVDLPREKRVDVGLTYIFGIGRNASADILEKAAVNAATRVKDLSEDEIVKLREIIEREYEVEGDLRKDMSMNIKRLIDIGTYRGLRHRKGLPVRGQRTKTNARTRKGRRGAIGKARTTPATKPAAAPSRA
jgi:small subunit ribosomal protein S13